MRQQIRWPTYPNWYCHSPRLTNRLTDWRSFQFQLKETIDSSHTLSTENQLDDKIEKFVQDIQQALRNNMLLITPRNKGINYSREMMISKPRKQPIKV